jgi:predicted Rossmann-fold nucleotide-binding protein
MMGTKYWEGLIRWMEKVLVVEGTISRTDLDLFYLTDDPHEAVNFIIQFHRDRALPAGEERRKTTLPPVEPPAL